MEQAASREQARQGAGRRRHRGHARQDPDIRLSKTLSYILRHGAAELGLVLGKDGFLDVGEVLRCSQCRHYTEKDIQRVVESNNKQRFSLRRHPDTGMLQIRANQGHSLQVEELELIPITEAAGNIPEQAVHGTYRQHWDSIKVEGLRCMSRRHIHLAPGLPGQGGVVSGIRSDCELAIFIELGKAINDGIPFYFSTNRVILTPGNEDGVLPPKYFQRVLQLKPSRCVLPLD